MRPDVFRRLSALSEPLRGRLLHVLSRDELGVGELAQVLQVPQPTVSRHLKQLHTEGWLERRSVGTASFFRLAEPLPDGADRLWAVVRDELEASGAFDEDLRRMDSVLAQREAEGQGFFGRNAERWEALRRELFGTHYLLPTLAALLPDDAVVADLGCGTGELLAMVAPAVGRVVGVDQEAAMLAAARRRVEGLGNVTLVQGGLEDLPLAPASVDLALCMLVLHHVEDVDAALAAAARALVPGGRLVVLDMVEHDRREYRHTMGHRHLGFSEQRLSRVTDLRLVSYRRLPPEPEALGPGLFLATFRG